MKPGMTSVLCVVLLCGTESNSQDRGMLSVPSNAVSGKRIALVIGNGAYKESPLRNPVRDAQLIGSVLKNAGFEVTCEENLDQRRLRTAIREFGKKISKQTIALFYFAGHGVQVDTRNYLVPIGALIEKEEDVENEAVDLTRVTSEMFARPDRMNIIILDACRNNPFATNFRSQARGLAPVVAPSGTIIAYATAPGMTASDGEGRNSVFTEALAHAIQLPGLKIEETLKATRAQVQKLTRNKQVPWETSSIVGDFVFTAGEARLPEERPDATVDGSVVSSSGESGIKWIHVVAGAMAFGSATERIPVEEFFLSAAEVTFEQYDKFCEATRRRRADDNGWGRGSRPATNVSWLDAKAYCEWLSQETGFTVRLPREIEWEFAARGGNASKGYVYSGGDDVDQCAWYGGNSNGRTNPICQKRSNELGLSDMSGNVWEWCEDIYSPSLQTTASSSPPLSTTVDHVIRGGAWNSAGPRAATVFDRSFMDSGSKYNACGFRLLREASR